MIFENCRLIYFEFKNELITTYLKNEETYLAINRQMDCLLFAQVNRLVRSRSRSQMLPNQAILYIQTYDDQ